MAAATISKVERPANYEDANLLLRLYELRPRRLQSVGAADRERERKPVQTAGAFQIGGSQDQLTYLCQIDQDGLFREA